MITIDNKAQTLDFKLKTILLNEVQVVADIAIDRETPVAFSTIPMKKISEELASQDIPVILNDTQLNSWSLCNTKWRWRWGCQESRAISATT
jgi:pyrrolidone-carboxylate peptidase